MNLYWDSSTIIVDANLALLTVHSDLDGVHSFIALVIVGSVDQDLVENLVQARNEADFPHFHRVLFRVEDPHLLLTTLNGSNVRIRSFYYVLQLRKLVGR